uniref:Peptidase_S26 domain-containing protein n=1 Tax=Panagrellus redivivus TaxID=6233 RepID=A0A7E4VZ14_PANRE
MKTDDLLLVIQFDRLFKDEPPHVPIENASDGLLADDSPGMLFFQNVDRRRFQDYVYASYFLGHARMRDYIIFDIVKQIRGSSVEKMRWFFQLDQPLDAAASEHPDSSGWGDQ